MFITKPPSHRTFFLFNSSMYFSMTGINVIMLQPKGCVFFSHYCTIGPDERLIDDYLTVIKGRGRPIRDIRLFISTGVRRGRTLNLVLHHMTCIFQWASAAAVIYSWSICIERADSEMP